MSSSIWFGQRAVPDCIARPRTPRGRVYVDVGAHEGPGTLRDARALGRLLVRKGFVRHRKASSRAASRLRYVEDQAGRHNEASWARLECALEFLLA